MVEPPPEHRKIVLETHDLDAAATMMMKKLSERELGNLHFSLLMKPQITMGTMCSGTDVCVHSVKAALKAANSELSGKYHHHVGDMMHASVVAKFACDIKPLSQNFIIRLHSPSPECLFRDVCELGNRTAFDVLSKSQKHVPGVMWAVSGFCCTDLSRFNKNSHGGESSQTIANSDKRTGATFAGTLAYIARFRPLLITMENIPAIDDISKETGLSNLDVAIQRLEEQGYVILTLKLDPRDHGVPHRRTRCSGYG